MPVDVQHERGGVLDRCQEVRAPVALPIRRSNISQLGLVISIRNSNLSQLGIVSSIRHSYFSRLCVGTLGLAGSDVQHERGGVLHRCQEVRAPRFLAA